MATLPSSKPNPSRSISLPVRSHPTTRRVEGVLNKLNGLATSSNAPTAETIYNCLLGVDELQNCMDELISLPQTLQMISKHQYGKWFEELLGRSVRILDVCGSIRELVSHYKERVRALQSSHRRRQGDSSAEAGIARFTTFSKKLKKDAKRLVMALKEPENLSRALLEGDDEEAIAVIRAIREANAVCVLVFQMLLSFLSVPLLKPKQTKWSLVSKMVNSETTTTILETRLDTLEVQLGSIEQGLEGALRSLIRSRSFLLNVLSF